MPSLNGSLFVLCAFCATKLFAAVNFEDFYDLDGFSMHCGTHAVLLCLAEKELGGMENFAAVDEFLDPDGDGTTSFSLIIECLDAYGVKATGYRGTLSDLAVGGEFILQIKLRGEPHFSYTQIDTETADVSIFDPAIGSNSLTVSLEDLGKVWSGNFIEISTTTIHASKI